MFDWPIIPAQYKWRIRRSGTAENEKQEAEFPLVQQREKKLAYLTHAICVGNFRRFLSLPRRDIFACLLLQLLRVNLTSFLPPTHLPGRVAPSAAILPSFRPALPLSLMYLGKFLRGLGNRIQIRAEFSSN